MMEETSAAAFEAAPEAIVEAPAGETEGQTEGQAAEGQPEEKKSASAERREREKAYRERLKAEAATALAKADEAETRRRAILEAGSREAPPKEQDFPDPIEFAAAKAIWGAEQRAREREANGAGEAAKAAKQQAEEFTQRERAVLAEAWTAQVADAKTRYADFDAVAHAKDLPVTPAMGDIIMTSDNGPDVLYFLGQNRALAAQIAAMHPVEAARAIGRIEATLSLPKPRTETNAPAPISPVRGSAGAGRDPSKMSFAEFKAYRERGGTIGPRS
jgi:hypothetical protein